MRSTPIYLSRALLSVALASTPGALQTSAAQTSIDDEESKLLIDSGFALRDRASSVQEQARGMLLASRGYEKDALALARLEGSSGGNVDLALTSELLSRYGAEFREAHEQMNAAAESLLRKGFLLRRRLELTHEGVMYIEGSLANGKPSGLMQTSFSSQNKPDALDTTIARTTRNGSYYVIIQSLDYPLHVNVLHDWHVMVSDRHGQPVSGVEISVKGDMPSHGHGLPTLPRVRSEVAPGVYRLEGMKFQMRGWWVVELDIAGPAGSDGVRFNLDL